MSELRFAILGAPRTKKNSSRIVQRGGRPRILPSEAYERWEREAVFVLPNGRNVLLAPAWTAGPANLCAHFYLDANRKTDAVGLYQGLADLLQARGCVTDDVLFVSWDGSRVSVDRVNPRVEVVITEAAQEVAA